MEQLAPPVEQSKLLATLLCQHALPLLLLLSILIARLLLLLPILIGFLSPRFNDEETVTEVSIHFLSLLDFTFKITTEIKAHM